MELVRVHTSMKGMTCRIFGADTLWFQGSDHPTFSLSTQCQIRASRKLSRRLPAMNFRTKQDTRARTQFIVAQEGCIGGKNGDSDGQSGIALLDHDTFDVIGPWESDHGPQRLSYDAWWHLNRN